VPPKLVLHACLEEQKYGLDIIRSHPKGGCMRIYSLHLVPDKYQQSQIHYCILVPLEGLVPIGVKNYG
jgi:hypothetical protein